MSYNEAQISWSISHLFLYVMFWPICLHVVNIHIVDMNLWAFKVKLIRQILLDIDDMCQHMRMCYMYLIEDQPRHGRACATMHVDWTFHRTKCSYHKRYKMHLDSFTGMQWPYAHYNIFTFPLRVFKCTFTFEMWFIPSWTNRFKPHPHTRHLSGLTSSPSYNVACLLTFAWRWTRIAMTLSAEIWRFGYSKPYVMSDLIQNIWKTSQVVWKLKIDTWLII